MPIYKYTAKDIQSATVHGTINAQNEEQFQRRIRTMNLFLVKYDEVASDEHSYRLKAIELSDFARQIGTMLSSGVSLIRAVDIMMMRDTKPKIMKIYKSLYQQLQNGVVLSDAMSSMGNSFPDLMIQMFRSGESNGSLDKAAAKIADHYEREHKLKNKIKSAITYPIILLCLTVVIVLLIFIVVLPNFFDLFADIELPWSTQLLMGISNFLMNHWLEFIIGVMLVIMAIALMVRIPVVHLKINQWMLKIPKIGKLLKIIYTSRFARTLSSMYSSGLSMIQALEVTSTTIGNRYIERQFPDMIARVRNGDPLSAAVRDMSGFDPKLASTIFVGEEAGRLDNMLSAMADSFDYESSQATEKLVTYIEPVMIVTMAVIIGFIMISVMLPIYTLYQNIG